MKKLILLFAIVFCITNINANDGLHIGDTATDFNLKNIDGKMVSLADYNDANGFIIIFTCNHCPYSKAYEDRIIALDKKYADVKFPVIAISSNDAVQYPEDDFDNMKKRAKEKSFTFPYLYDETQTIAKQYGALKTPHVFILLKDNGQLITKYIGAIDDNWEDATAVTEKYVENALNNIIEGKKVPVPLTKAIGCGIKWKKTE